MTSETQYHLHLWKVLNKHITTMIHLVMNDLRQTVGKGSDASLEFSGLPLYFDSLIAFAFSGASVQRKTIFL